MPVWVIGLLVGMFISVVRHEVHVHYKAPPPKIEATARVASLPLDCREGDRYGLK